MTIAIFGLVGVVVGALVTGAVNLWLERIREGNAIRMAKRLVADELHTVWGQLLALAGAAESPDETETVKEKLLPSDDWRKYRETLAAPRALNQTEWTTLSTTFYSVEILRGMVLDQPPRTPLAQDMLDRLPSFTDHVGEVYERLAGEPPYDPVPRH